MRNIMVIIAIACIPVLCSAQYYMWEYPDDAGDAHLARGLQYLRSGENKKALIYFQQAKHSLPQSPVPNLLIGDVYLKEELYKPALKEYYTALEKNTNDNAIWSVIAYTYGMMKEYTKRAVILNEALTRFSNISMWDRQELYIDMAWNYFKLNDYDNAKALLTNGINEFAWVTSSYKAMLAIACNYTYDLERAEKYYKESLQIGLASWYYNYALFKLMNFQYKRAEELLLSALHYDENSYATERQLAELYTSQLNEIRSEQHLTHAVQLEMAGNRSLRSSLFKMEWLLTFGKIDEAEKTARSLLQHPERLGHFDFIAGEYDDYSSIYYLLSEVYRARHEIEKNTLFPRFRFSFLIDIVRQNKDGKKQWHITSHPDRVCAPLFSLVKKIYYKNRSAVYMRRADRIILRSARETFSHGDQFGAQRDFYNALALQYSGSSRYFLRHIQSRMLELWPDMKAYINYGQGQIMLAGHRNKRALMYFWNAYEGFQSFWEDNMRALARIHHALAAQRLGEIGIVITDLTIVFELNPAYLPQYGFGLPMDITFSGEWSDQKKEKIVRRRLMTYLKRKGFILMNCNGTALISCQTLNAPYELEVYFRDTNHGSSELTYRIASQFTADVPAHDTVLFPASQHGVNFDDAIQRMVQSMHEKLFYE